MEQDHGGAAFAALHGERLVEDHVDLEDFLAGDLLGGGVRAGRGLGLLGFERRGDADQCDACGGGRSGVQDAFLHC